MKSRFLSTFLLAVPAVLDGDTLPADAVEHAHTVLWEKFVDSHGLIRDFVGEIPTPEDCEQGRPNAIGWWSPIENGPMFTGLYLPAACERARRSGQETDREAVRRLVQGLLLCASVSDVPGFVARGVGTDGRCHYPMGSDDQTHPWFYGLHAYVTSGLPDAAERTRVAGRMKEVAEVLAANGWRCPCDGAFKGQFRGGYRGHLFRDAVRYLYLLRAMHEVTGEDVWLERYRAALAESPDRSGGKTRAEICSLGFRADREAIPHLDEGQMWIYVGCQGSLARLIAMEHDETVRRYYRAGLAQNAADARGPLAGYRAFDNQDRQVFGHADWRTGYPEWFPQKTQKDAELLARKGNREKLGTRKEYERRTMRNPLAAAAIVALAGDETDREEISRAISHYDYGCLNMVEFFFAECTFYALPPLLLVQDFAGTDAASSTSGEEGAVRSVVPGTKGNALWFWGERGQGVPVPGSTAIAATDELTIGAWIWLWRTGDHQTLIWKGDRKPAIDQVQFRLSVRPEGHLEFTFKGAVDEWYQIIAPEPLPVGQWVYVAAGFNRGQATLDVGGRRVAADRVRAYAIPADEWHGERLLLNSAPVEIGAGQEPSGEPGQFFCGAIDEVRVWAKAFDAPLPCADGPDGSPLAALTLFENTFSAAEIRERPWLVGCTGTGRDPWVLTADFPGTGRSAVHVRGAVGADPEKGEGTFRYLLDDYCGLIDLRGAERVRIRGYRLDGTRPLPAGGAALTLQADDRTAHVVVQAGTPLQTLRGFGCYADLPRTVPADPAERERAWGPVLDALREAGVTQLDFSFGTQLLEPHNDDADPSHLEWTTLRQIFAESKGLRTLSAYLNFVRARGFEVGLRAISFAGWQWKGQGAERVPDPDEVAESCVALLLLLQEEGLSVSHLVPVWEPSYPPEVVAQVCARTAKLARQHGLDLPVVGPYRIATGGQSIDMEVMPDRYLNGQQYVSAYLEAMGDLGTVVGVEDYASGWAGAEANLIRLRQEVIEPFGPVAGHPRELWLLEYGPLCGIGPWNFYPSRWHGAYTGYASAFRLARMTHQALNGGVNSFFFWKAYDTVGDGANISSFGLVKGRTHDFEKRPPYHTARVLWRHVPRGSRYVASTADGGVLASAFETADGMTVLLTNPRSCGMEIDLRLPAGHWAPVGQVFGTDETIAYREHEVLLKEEGTVHFEMPPRSVAAFVCRNDGGTAPYERTVWPSDEEGVDYLSDLLWSAVSVAGQTGLSSAPISGKNVTVHQDGTPSCEWLTLAGVRYRKGLGTMTPAEVVYPLGGRYGRFEAKIGIDDRARKMTADENIIFTVYADGKAVFTSDPLKAEQDAVPVHVSITGTKVLKLTVTGAKGVAADWAEARVIGEGQ